MQVDQEKPRDFKYGIGIDNKCNSHIMIFNPEKAKQNLLIFNKKF